MKQEIYEYLMMHHQGFDCRIGISELHKQFKTIALEDLEEFIYQIHISMECPNMIILSDNEIYACKNTKEISNSKNELMKLYTEPREVQQIVEWKQELFKLFHNA